MPTFYNFTNNDIFGNLFPNISSGEAFRRYGDRSTFTGSNTYTISSQVSPFNSPSCSVFVPTSAGTVRYLCTENSLPPFSPNSNVVTKCESPRVYQISFYIKGITYPAGCLVRGDLNWRDDDGSGFNPASSSPDVALNGSWQYVNFTVTIAAGSQVLTRFRYGSLTILLVLLSGTFTDTEVLISDVKITDSTFNYKTSFDDQFIPADTFRQGNLFTSGLNNVGQLGNNTSIRHSSLVVEFTNSSNWRQISVGDSHMAAIKTDGSLWTWGQGSSGQLGINNLNARFTPVREFTSSNDWTFVTCCGNNTAAIKSDGTLWLWGNNQSAQLGTNDNTTRLTPVREFTSSTNWKFVDLGTQPFRTAAIKSDGTLWVWGGNIGIFSPGALGLNDGITGRSTPVQEWTSSTNWKKVITKYNMSAGLKTDGTIWMWGRNNTGQFGVIGDSGNRSTPSEFLHNSFLGFVKELAGNGESFHAIKNDGTLWSWGRSDLGELATAGGLPQPGGGTPRKESTSSTNWKKVFSDNSSNGGAKAAIKSDGSLWVWGATFTTSGQLGLNNLITYSSPVQALPQNVKWKEARMGDTNSCFLTYIDPII